MAYDFGPKKEAYRRNGVGEYLIYLSYDKALHWFVLKDGVYLEHKPDADGIYRSATMPGLWLDRAAFLAGDMAQVYRILQQGIATPEHAAFAAKLQPPD